MKELFSGLSRRQKTSFDREYEWLIRTVAAGDNFSNEIPFYQAAGIAIFCPSGLSATHIALYGSFESGGVPRPIYDKDDTHLVVTVEADSIVVLPADLFPIGWLFLGLASDSSGTLTTEQADFDFLVMMKP